MNYNIVVDSFPFETEIDHTENYYFEIGQQKLAYQVGETKSKSIPILRTEKSELILNMLETGISEDCSFAVSIDSPIKLLFSKEQNKITIEMRYVREELFYLVEDRFPVCVSNRFKSSEYAVILLKNGTLTCTENPVETGFWRFSL